MLILSRSKEGTERELKTDGLTPDSACSLKLSKTATSSFSSNTGVMLFRTDGDNFEMTLRFNFSMIL